jgi:chromosome segregation ATPase
MKNLLTLTILAGGLSLHAMNDDAAQLKALENELAKLTIQHDTLEQEFREWNTSMVEEERELEPRFQWLWQEIPKVKSQQEALQKQIKQKKEAAQLNALVAELEKLNSTRTMIYQELLDGGPGGSGLLATDPDLYGPHLQKRHNELEKMDKRVRELEREITQKKEATEQKKPTPSEIVYGLNRTLDRSLWFHVGTSYDSEKK